MDLGTFLTKTVRMFLFWSSKEIPYNFISGVKLPLEMDCGSYETEAVDS